MLVHNAGNNNCYYVVGCLSFQVSNFLNANNLIAQSLAVQVMK